IMASRTIHTKNPARYEDVTEYGKQGQIIAPSNGTINPKPSVNPSVTLSVNPTDVTSHNENGIVMPNNGRDNPNIPAYADGVDSVPVTGPAIVHQGEKIVPAASNPDNPNQQPQFSDLPEGASIVSVPKTPKATQAQTQAQTFSDLPEGATVLHVPQPTPAQAKPAYTPTTAPEDMGGTGFEGGQYTEGSASQMAKGAGSEALGMGAGLVTGSVPYQSLQELSQIPAEYRAFEQARKQGKGYLESAKAATDVIQKKNDAVTMLKDRVKEFSTNPSHAIGRAIVDLIPIALGVTSLAGAPAEAAAAETATAEAIAPEAAQGAEAITNNLTKPGIVQQVLKGEKVAQPGAQAAVRTSTQAAAETSGTDASLTDIQSKPLVSGHNTVLDEHLSKLGQKEAAAYKAMDETAGFDVKGEKAPLAHDKYKLKQLGNTDADVPQKGNLIDAINDSTDRITEAESKMQDAGIDPKA